MEDGAEYTRACTPALAPVGLGRSQHDRDHVAAEPRPQDEPTHDRGAHGDRVSSPATVRGRGRAQVGPGRSEA